MATQEIEYPEKVFMRTYLAYITRPSVLNESKGHCTVAFPPWLIIMLPIIIIIYYLVFFLLQILSQSLSVNCDSLLVRLHPDAKENNYDLPTKGEKIPS